jgi:signal transduction histidine kinase
VVSLTTLGGYRSVLCVPLLKEDELIGVISIYKEAAGFFTTKQVELITNFAAQAVIAIENTRLFEEIAQKSRELEIASQHKSQFVANMSHELRTPLAAILGYAELMQEGFYEPLGQKSLNALTRIRANGKHLLGLINTVLDIAKIESGQFSLNLSEYALENVVETVRAATEALAETKKLGLKTDVAERLPIGKGDEQRLTQVLLNLVGNAIKFTDAGEVRIIATASNGHFALSVTDTGPGIPQEHQARHLRAVPPGRQLQHKGQGRHRAGARHRQTDRGDARRPHLGRVDRREGLDVPDGDSYAHRHYVTKSYSPDQLFRLYEGFSARKL